MSEWKVRLVVEVYGVNNQEALDDVIDRINEIGYVSDVNIQTEKNEEK